MSLQFKECVAPRGWITKVWYVLNASGMLGAPSHLGNIRWKSEWRRYWFEPSPSTGFDAACLDEISQFLKQEMAKRKT
jgi:hypothetical protein